MATGMNESNESHERLGADDTEDETDDEEISIFVTEDSTVVVEGSDWQIELTPGQARELSAAITEAAAEAEGAQ